MSAPKPDVMLPAIALNQQDAAAALGVCSDTFRDRIAPDLACIRLGRLRLYPVRELERWALEEAERTFA